MPKTTPHGPTIIVTGDVTIDWNVARLTQSQVSARTWNAGAVTRACQQPGGVLMLAEVVKAATADLAQANPGFQFITVSLPQPQCTPEDPRFHHSYAMWEPYPRDTRDKKPGLVWRVKDYLGLDGSCEPAGTCQPWPLPTDIPPHADLTILDDAALGFRQHPAVWPAAIRKLGAHSWVLVKMASPIAKGALWEQLVTHCAPHLVVVMTANDLRCTDIHISRELSWERTAQDLYWELTHNPSVQHLSRCAHVVVSFGTAGAFVLSRLPDVGTVPTWQCRLFFDALTYEGAWGPQYPGGVIGQTSCLTAAIARQLLLAPQHPDIARALQSGVAAMRTLQERGYGAQDPNGPLQKPQLPLEAITTALLTVPAPNQAELLAEATVEDPVRFLKEPSAPGQARSSDRFWTILDDVCRNAGHATPPPPSGVLLCRACEIVLNGPEAALKQVPLGKFGGLTTADRREIEAFHAVGALIAEYCSSPQERPLSIAVFGPPGSGKSFGVKQVAKTLGQGAIKDLTFNLSQYNDPNELLQALHQVRDEVLSGKIPLVFWDEFDTTLGVHAWGWLRHFLAPMQDGSFQEGQITHPIGRAIFVFAGGTSHSIDAFDRHPDDPRYDAFVAAKGPDFLSRLKGYINIIGPNENRDRALTADDHHLIRRAILLRGMLARNAPQLFASGDGTGTLSIDAGVLRAFLQIREYRHGARSMESIIAMSRLSGKRMYERSALPSEAQLNIHVHGREFHALVQAPELTGELLEKLAAAAHSVYSNEQLAKEKTEHIKAPAIAHLTYDQLVGDLEEFKEQNRANVRDISVKLAVIGCIMIAARGDEPPSGFPGVDLEMLAEMEHDRWLKLKARQGWRYGVTTDKAKMENEALLPWHAMTREELVNKYGVELAAVMGASELPEEQKEKDRTFVSAIPAILAEAGYTVAKL